MAPTKKKEVNIPQDVILNVNTFIRENSDVLIEHYYSVINEESESKEMKLAKNNNIYKYIELSDYNAKLLRVSIVILTANFFECEILNYNIFKCNKTKIEKLKDGINIFPQKEFRRTDAYLMNINGYSILHLHAPETGSNTPCGSTDLVRYVTNNKFLYPSYIISFGICYGINPKKQKLGNTIIANRIYPCSIGIKINDNSWQIKHDEYILNLQEKDTKLYYNIQNVISGIQNNTPNVTFHKVDIGNMLTGEAVVSNERFKIESIEKAHGCKILGGEMEGYGMAKECIYYSNISCLIIKAICDWGACKNIDDYLDPDLPEKTKIDCKGKIQAYTAYCAYTVLNKLFQEKVFSSNNILETVEKDIINNYYDNGYIQHKALKRHIIKFLEQKFSKESLIVQNSNVLSDLLIEKCLSSHLEKCIEENIIGYMFK